MKKYIIALTAVLMIVVTGCQEGLEELFPDPNSYEPTEEVVEKLFAQVLQYSGDMNNCTMSFYWQMGANGYGWPVRTHITNDWHSHAGYEDYDNFEQSMPVKGTGSTYNYNRERFRALPEIESRIADLTEGMMVYSHTLRIMWLKYVLASVDVYNSIPYFGALQGVDAVFYPKFDDPWEIYQDVLARFKEEADNLEVAYGKMTAEEKAAFEHHDIYFEGDITKWVALAEAYRLRYAIRVSGVYPSEASAIINEVVSRGKLPAVDLEIAIAGWMGREGWGISSRKGNMGKFTYQAFMGYEHLSWLDVNENRVYDEGIDDPRLPVVAMPNKEGLYTPVSYDYNVAQAVEDSSLTYNKEVYGYNHFYRDQKSWYRNIEEHCKYDPYAHWNGLVFVALNEPECYFSLAEVELLLCEAVEKGLVSNTGKTARKHIEDATVYSTNYWYHILNDYAVNSSSLSTIPELLNGIPFRDIMVPSTPSSEVVNGYATKIGQSYEDASGIEDKMEIIMQQKFTTLNLHNVMECYTEFRRTRHPVLCSFRVQDGSIRETKMVERQRYPTDPAAYNTTNFTEVISQDNFTTPIFWVPENLRSVQPYEINEKAWYIEYPGIEESFNPN